MPDNIIETVFKNHKITTILYHGQPTWRADEVAVVLGYSETNKLTRKLTNEWKDSLRKTLDYFVLTGGKFNVLKKLLKETPGSGVSSSNTMTLFTKSGVELVCMLSRAKLANEFRFHLVDHVFPKLEQGNLPVVNQSSDRALAERQEDRLMLHEQRMMEQVKMEMEQAKVAMVQAQTEALQVQAKIREQQADVLEATAVLLKDGGHIDIDVFTAYKVTAAELKMGMDLTQLRPSLEGGEWKTPGEIAEETGFSTQKVGFIISKIGNLRGNSQYSKMHVFVNPKTCQMKKSYFYNEAAVAKIEHELTGGQLPLI